MIDRLLWVMAIVGIAAALWWLARRTPARTLDPITETCRLLYFWGPGCAACLHLKKALDVVLQENRSWLELKSIDASIERREAKEWGVWTLPTLLLIDDAGRTIFRKTGAVSLTDLRGAIASVRSR